MGLRLWTAAAILALGLCVAPAPARAEQYMRRASLITVGLTLGARFGLGREDLTSFVLGAETSVVSLGNSMVWYGAYADVVYDFGYQATRVTVGPEFGWAYFGGDGGLAVQFDREGSQFGFAVRPLMTLGVAAAFLRLEHFPGPDSSPGLAEVGALLKAPLPLRR